MGNLIYQLNSELLNHNKHQLVPSIFTQKQLGLIQKKLQAKELNPTQRSYFSRTITKKLEAISILAGTQSRYFISGEKFMLPERREQALRILKRFERNHKKVKVVIAGSFLYNEKYQDIDIFIISKYNKDDFKKGKLHINYLKEENTNSIFFNSLIKISLANFNTDFIKVKENITMEQIISKYQEIMHDFEINNKSWLKIDLRDFIIDCHYAGQKIILDSIQLRDFLQNLLAKKNKDKIIEKIFINTLLMGFKGEEVKTLSLSMIKSYQELIQEYKNKQYYQQLIKSFEEVLNNAG